MEFNTILQGSALERLKELPNDSIDTVITSPPYWALRAYKTTPQIWDADPNCEHDWNTINDKLHAGRGDAQKSSKYSEQEPIPDTPIEYGFCSKCKAWRGELGLEPNFDLFLNHLLQIFDEVKRVLKKTGTVWVNLGDTFAGGGKGQKDTGKHGYAPEEMAVDIKPSHKVAGIQNKSLLAIPDRFKIRMIDSGWICRNEIIWYKRNCMPSSAKDRFTVDYEKIFFFTKEERYYFETQYEPYQEGSIARLYRGNSDTHKNVDGAPGQTPHSIHQPRSHREMPKFGGNKAPGYDNPTYSGKEWKPNIGKTTVHGNPLRGLHERYKQEGRSEYDNPFGRFKRCVWDITTKGFSGAHFATFPEDLVEIPIKAGCPEYACKKCGVPRFPIMEPSEEYAKYLGKGWHDHSDDDEQGMSQEKQLPSIRSDYRKVGLSDCGCKEWVCDNCGINVNNTTVIVSGVGTDGNDKLQTMWNRNAENTRSSQETNENVLRKDMRGDLERGTPERNELQNDEHAGLLVDLEQNNTNIQSGTPNNNGTTSSPETIKIRSSSSQKRDKNRQSDREFDITHHTTTQQITTPQKTNNNNMSELRKTTSYQPSKLDACPNCGTSRWQPGIVLDCFFGSGTVGVVALKHARRFLGIELNASYVEMAQARLKPFLQQSKLF